MKYSINSLFRTAAGIIIIMLLLPLITPQLFADQSGGPLALSAESVRQLCLPGAPRAECGSFIVAEVALLARVVNSHSTESVTLHNGVMFHGDDFGFPGALQGELGLMYNLSGKSAVGVTAAGVVEEYRNRIGGKVHYRFWEGEGASIDLSAGIFTPVAQDDFLEVLDRKEWLVGTFALSQRDCWQFIFQLESYTQAYPEGRRASAFYTGVQFRDWPGSATAIAGLISAVVVAVESL